MIKLYFSSFRYILLSFFLLLSLSLSAQSVNSFGLTGKVIDAEKIRLEAATVILLNSIDSSIVKVEISSNQGNFTFNNLQAGSYLIAVSSVGYVKNTSGPYILKSTDKIKDIGNIQLKLYNKLLNEVDIEAKNRFVEVTAGKVSLNVANSILSSGSTAFDILNRAPGVQIDNSDLIKLNGKAGVLVLVNGKETFMETANLIDMLKSMQSSNIESIELISNPTAKYSAAGIASIINIKVKKNKNYGTNGVISAMAGLGSLGNDYDPNFRYNGGLSVNHRNKFLNVFGNYTHADINQSKYITSNRQLQNLNQTAIDVDYFSTQERLSDNYRAGIDFSLSPSHVIGVLYSGSRNDIAIEKNNQSDIYNQGKVDSTIFAASGQNRLLTNNNYNLNYKGSLGEKIGNVSIDFDYLRYKRQSIEMLTNTFQTASGSSYRDELDLLNNSPSNYNIKSVKADYTLPLNKSSSLDLGIQASNVLGKNYLNFGPLVNTVFYPDSRFTNTYNIDEKIRAAFFSYNKEFKNSSIVIGLRAEQTKTNGQSITTGTNYIRDYTDLFPNFQYTQTLNKNNKLLLSLGRRIGRPGYEALNPFLAYLDQYSFKSGNPYLKPAYTNNAEATHVYKDKISTTLRLSFVKDVFLDINNQNDQTFVNTIMTQNLDRQLTYGLEVNAPLDITDWWNIELNMQANMVSYSTQSSIGAYTNSSPDIIFNTLQNFTLSKNIKAEISTEYENPTVYGVYNFDASYNVDAGFSASMFKKQGNLRLRLTDIFNISQSRYSSFYENLNLNMLNKLESRTAQLSFSYNFGKTTIKSARRRSTGSETEQNRVGN